MWHAIFINQTRGRFSFIFRYKYTRRQTQNINPEDEASRSRNLCPHLNWVRITFSLPVETNGCAYMAKMGWQIIPSGNGRYIPPPVVWPPRPPPSLGHAEYYFQKNVWVIYGQNKRGGELRAENLIRATPARSEIRRTDTLINLGRPALCSRVFVIFWKEMVTWSPIEALMM